MRVIKVFSALPALLALVACGNLSTAPAPEPTPVEQAAGSLGAEYAGLTVQAYASALATDFFVGQAVVAEDGTFALTLPDDVPSEYLASGSEMFDCGNLPDFNTTLFHNVNVDVTGAMFVPEGTSTESMSSGHAVFIYSDRAVEIDTTCAATAAGARTAAADTTSIFRISLLLGWNLVFYQQANDQVSYEALNNPQLFLWLTM